MENKSKQWTEEETQCFLALWSSAEVQGKLDGATRTKPIFQGIQREMEAQGYQRSLDQLLNKLKKLKKEYRDQRRELGRSGSGRQKRCPHFELLDSVLGDRPANQATGALNSATAALDWPQDLPTPAPETELSLLDEEGQMTRCSSPVPSCSSSVPSLSSSASTQSRTGKRKRSPYAELIEYMDRADQKYFEQADRDNAVSTAVLDNMRDTKGLMERMVAAVERMANK